jgi:hypothetical protein
MSEIINIFLFEDIVKRKQNITVVNWNKNVPTMINKYTTSTGMLDSRIVGGSKKNVKRILVI